MDAKNAHADSIAASLLASRSGAAKIRLQDLQPENSLQVADQTQVRDLVHKFKAEGCQRLLARNRIPVIISRTLLQSLLNENHISETILTTSTLPLLNTSTPLTYVQGQGFHRIQAAKKLLPVPDQWWGIDIYVHEDLPENVLQFIREDRDNAKPLGDGLIYRKFVHYNSRRDSYGAKKWLARLSRTKQKDIKQLHRHRHAQSIKRALHKLLEYAALFDDFLLGTCHRFLPLKCPEEFAHYLHHVYVVWSSIVPAEYAAYLDHVTVKKLEGRCPFYSQRDRIFIRNASAKNIIFPLMPQSIRSDILSRVLQCRCIIPSIRTFLEDTKWFEPAARVLRSLLPDSRRTLRRSLKRCWVEPPQLREQQLRSMPPLSPRFATSKFWAAYVQLFSAAYRFFPSLTTHHPRKVMKGSLITSENRQAPAECWWRLARLAVALGFSSSEISRILTRPQIPFVAENLLNEARPPSLYTYTAEERRENLEELETILASAEEVTNTIIAAEMTSDVFQKWDVRHSCGRTFDQPFFNDQDYIYISNLYPGDEVSPSPRQTVTSFFVVKNTFHAFFGAPRNDSDFADDTASDLSDVSFDSEGDELLPDPSRIDFTEQNAFVESGPSQEMSMEFDVNQIEPVFDHQTVVTPPADHSEETENPRTAPSIPSLDDFWDHDSHTSQVWAPQSSETLHQTQSLTQILNDGEIPSLGPNITDTDEEEFDITQILQGYDTDSTHYMQTELPASSSIDTYDELHRRFSATTQFPPEDGFGSTERESMEQSNEHYSEVSDGSLRADTTIEAPKRKRAFDKHYLHIRFGTGVRTLESFLSVFTPIPNQLCIVKPIDDIEWEALFYRPTPSGLNGAEDYMKRNSRELCTFSTCDTSTGQVRSITVEDALRSTYSHDYVLLVTPPGHSFRNSFEMESQKVSMVRWSGACWIVDTALEGYDIVSNDSEGQSPTKRNRVSV